MGAQPAHPGARLPPLSNQLGPWAIRPPWAAEAVGADGSQSQEVFRRLLRTDEVKGIAARELTASPARKGRQEDRGALISA